MTPDDYEADGTVSDAGPSKTRRKTEARELQALGEALVTLNPDQLSRVDMPENLRDAVNEARRMRTHEARRRQMQYIGKLMRNIDPAPIAARLDEWRASSSEATATLHRIEAWRDRLAGDPAAFGEFATAYPKADLQQLRTLVRNVHREREQQKPPKNYRALFQALKAIISP